MAQMFTYIVLSHMGITGSHWIFFDELNVQIFTDFLPRDQILNKILCNFEKGPYLKITFETFEMIFHIYLLLPPPLSSPSL